VNPGWSIVSPGWSLGESSLESLMSPDWVLMSPRWSPGEHKHAGFQHFHIAMLLPCTRYGSMAEFTEGGTQLQGWIGRRQCINPESNKVLS